MTNGTVSFIHSIAFGGFAPQSLRLTISSDETFMPNNTVNNKQE